MAWTQHPEVSAVQGGKLRFVEALHDSQNGGIHEPDVRVCIPIAQLANAPIVLGQEIFDDVCALSKVVQERDEDTWMETYMNPVIDLHQDRRRHDQRLV